MPRNPFTRPPAINRQNNHVPHHGKNRPSDPWGKPKKQKPSAAKPANTTLPKLSPVLLKD